MSWTHLEEEEETRNFHFRRPVNACEGEGRGHFSKKWQVSRPVVSRRLWPRPLVLCRDEKVGNSISATLIETLSSGLCMSRYAVVRRRFQSGGND